MKMVIMKIVTKIVGVDDNESSNDDDDDGCKL